MGIPEAEEMGRLYQPGLVTGSCSASLVLLEPMRDLDLNDEDAGHCWPQRELEFRGDCLSATSHFFLYSGQSLSLQAQGPAALAQLPKVIHHTET